MELEARLRGELSNSQLNVAVGVQVKPEVDVEDYRGAFEQLLQLSGIPPSPMLDAPEVGDAQIVDAGPEVRIPGLP